MPQDLDTMPKERTATMQAPRKISLLKTKEEMTIGDYVRNYLLETLGIVFWVYAVTKLFIFDVDAWSFENFLPNHWWILNFKLIIILALTSLTWLWIGTRDIIVWFLYVAFYPLILLLIRLPHFLFKQDSWVLAFAILNAVASFFRTLKYSLVFTTIFLTAFSVALFSKVDYLLFIAAATLVALILVAYGRSFFAALKPTVIFQMYSNFFKGIRKTAHTSFALDAEIRDLPLERLNPKELEKFDTNLQMSVLFNRCCLFIATRLRDFQQSEWRMLPSIFGLLWLVAFTVVTFAGVNYSLFKASTTLFNFTNEPTFFTFLYYSFNNLVLNSTPELVPAMMLSQTTYMVQATLSFILVVIMATLYISHRAQRAFSELDEVIIAVETEGRDMESFIQTEYKIQDIPTAMQRLKEVQSGLVQFLYWLSRGIQ